MFLQLTHQARNDKQLRYLSTSERLEEADDPVMVKLTLLAISSCIAAFIVWASITNINEVARAPGEIVPQGFQQVVQHLEGGIVRQILVREGQAVEQGQTLVILDGNGAGEDLARAQQKQVALQMQQERLRAFIEHRKPDFGKFARTADPKTIRDQQGLFAAMSDSNGREADIVREQIGEKQATLRALESRRATVERNLAVDRDMYERRKTLQASGYVSKMSFLQAEKEMNDMQGESADLSAQASEAQAAMSEYAQRLESLQATNHDDAYKQLESVQNDLAQNGEILAKAQGTVGRLEVKAPVRGLVKGLSVNTVGAVVQPGQKLMDIIPLDQPLVAEIKIPPSQIGHIHEGEPVQLKVSAYDFSRYGALPGTLQSISPSTFEGEQGERFYKGRVALDRNYVGKVPGEYRLLPGMTVMADVVTGDKTIMDYLLKPITTNVKTAFTER